MRGGLPCERCERRPGTEVRGEELLCEACAQALDEAVVEREIERFHGGAAVWPFHGREARHR